MTAKEIRTQLPRRTPLNVLTMLDRNVSFPISRYRMLSLCLLSVSIWLIIVSTSMQSTDGAALNPIGKQRSSRDRGCYYMLQHYKNGEQIKTDEPCLNCTCENSMLMCYLRVCPYVKPVGDRCIIERVAGECCPRITCPDVGPPSDSFEQEAEPETALPTTSTSSTPILTIDSTNASIGMVGQTTGCTLGDKFYHDGAQMPSDPKKPCEVCYCIRNSSACVMQDCALEVSGCAPVYSAGGCCPSRYNCSAENAFTTPRPGLGSSSKRRFWELYPSSLDMFTTEGITYLKNATISTTTPSPIIFPDFGRTKNHLGASGCRAPNSTKVFADGERVPSKNKCEHCYCMRSEIVCAVQECRPPCDGCVPIIDSGDQCCPKRYECVAPTKRVSNENVIDAQELDSSSNEKQQSTTEAPTIRPLENGTAVSDVLPTSKQTEAKTSEFSSTTQNPTSEPADTIDSEAGVSQKPKAEVSVMTTRQTKPPIRPISPKLSTQDESNASDPSLDAEARNSSKTDAKSSNVDGFNLHGEREQESDSDKMGNRNDVFEGPIMQTDTIETSSPSSTSTISPIPHSSDESITATATASVHMESMATPSDAHNLVSGDRKSRPLVVPSTIPGEGSCRYNGRIYQNGEEIKSKNNCTEMCLCANSVVYCDEIDCPKGPRDPENCQKVTVEGECCPKYICPEETSTTPEPKTITPSPTDEGSLNDRSTIALANTTTSSDPTIPVIETSTSLPNVAKGEETSNVGPSVSNEFRTNVTTKIGDDSSTSSTVASTSEPSMDPGSDPSHPTDHGSDIVESTTRPDTKIESSNAPATVSPVADPQEVTTNTDQSAQSLPGHSGSDSATIPSLSMSSSVEDKLQDGSSSTSTTQSNTSPSGGESDSINATVSQILNEIAASTGISSSAKPEMTIPDRTTLANDSNPSDVITSQPTSNPHSPDQDLHHVTESNNDSHIQSTLNPQYITTTSMPNMNSDTTKIAPIAVQTADPPQVHNTAEENSSGNSETKMSTGSGAATSAPDEPEAPPLTTTTDSTNPAPDGAATMRDISNPVDQSMSSSTMAPTTDTSVSDEASHGLNEVPSTSMSVETTTDMPHRSSETKSDDSTPVTTILPSSTVLMSRDDSATRTEITTISPIEDNPHANSELTTTQEPTSSTSNSLVTSHTSITTDQVNRLESHNRVSTPTPGYDQTASDTSPTQGPSTLSPESTTNNEENVTNNPSPSHVESGKDPSIDRDVISESTTTQEPSSSTSSNIGADNELTPAHQENRVESQEKPITGPSTDDNIASVSTNTTMASATSNEGLISVDQASNQTTSEPEINHHDTSGDTLNRVESTDQPATNPPVANHGISESTTPHEAVSPTSISPSSVEEPASVGKNRGESIEDSSHNSPINDYAANESVTTQPPVDSPASVSVQEFSVTTTDPSSTLDAHNMTPSNGPVYTLLGIPNVTQTSSSTVSTDGVSLSNASNVNDSSSIPSHDSMGSNVQNTSQSSSPPPTQVLSNSESSPTDREKVEFDPSTAQRETIKIVESTNQPNISSEISTTKSPAFPTASSPSLNVAHTDEVSANSSDESNTVPVSGKEPTGLIVAQIPEANNSKISPTYIVSDEIQDSLREKNADTTLSISTSAPIAKSEQNNDESNTSEMSTKSQIGLDGDRVVTSPSPDVEHSSTYSMETVSSGTLEQATQPTNPINFAGTSSIEIGTMQPGLNQVTQTSTSTASPPTIDAEAGRQSSGNNNPQLEAHAHDASETSTEHTDTKISELSTTQSESTTSEKPVDEKTSEFVPSSSSPPKYTGQEGPSTTEGSITSVPNVLVETHNGATVPEAAQPITETNIVLAPINNMTSPSHGTDGDSKSVQGSTTTGSTSSSDVPSSVTIYQTSDINPNIREPEKNASITSQNSSSENVHDQSMHDSSTSSTVASTSEPSMDPGSDPSHPTDPGTDIVESTTTPETKIESSNAPATVSPVADPQEVTTNTDQSAQSLSGHSASDSATIPSLSMSSSVEDKLQDDSSSTSTPQYSTTTSIPNMNSDTTKIAPIAVHTADPPQVHNLAEENTSGNSETKMSTGSEPATSAPDEPEAPPMTTTTDSTNPAPDNGATTRDISNPVDQSMTSSTMAPITDTPSIDEASHGLNEVPSTSMSVETTTDMPHRSSETKSDDSTHFTTIIAESITTTSSPSSTVLVSKDDSATRAEITTISPIEDNPHANSELTTTQDSSTAGLNGSSPSEGLISVDQASNQTTSEPEINHHDTSGDTLNRVESTDQPATNLPVANHGISESTTPHETVSPTSVSPSSVEEPASVGKNRAESHEEAGTSTSPSDHTVSEFTTTPTVVTTSLTSSNLHEEVNSANQSSISSMSNVGGDGYSVHQNDRSQFNKESESASSIQGHTNFESTTTLAPPSSASSNLSSNEIGAPVDQMNPAKPSEDSGTSVSVSEHGVSQESTTNKPLNMTSMTSDEPNYVNRVAGESPREELVTSKTTTDHETTTESTTTQGTSTSFSETAIHESTTTLAPSSSLDDHNKSSHDGPSDSDVAIPQAGSSSSNATESISTPSSHEETSTFAANISEPSSTSGGSSIKVDSTPASLDLSLDHKIPNSQVNSSSQSDDSNTISVSSSPSDLAPTTKISVEKETDFGSSHAEVSTTTDPSITSSGTTISPADQFITSVTTTNPVDFKPVNVTTVIPSIRGSAAPITIPWADISNITLASSPDRDTTASIFDTTFSGKDPTNFTRKYTYESTTTTVGSTATSESDYEEITEESGCEYEGKSYNSAQQIPRSHPCDFCFCFRGDIICLQQTCPPPVPHCFETVIDGFCCPRYECPVHTVRTSPNSTSLSLTPYETHSRLHAHTHDVERSNANKTTSNVRGCFVDNKLYGIGQVISSASGPCLDCICDKSGMMRCNPKECTPDDPLLQQINREVLQSTLSRSQAR